MFHIVILQFALSQTPPPVAAPASTTEERALQAADAAQKAADAAQKAAEAAQKIAEQMAASAKPPPPCAVVVPPPPPAPVASPWSASVGMGLISLTGNTSSITASGNAAVSRTEGDWIFGGKLSGTYGQSRPEAGGDAQVLALMGSLQLRADRKFGDRFAAYLLGGLDTDHVKSVEYRAYGEPGASLFWFNTKQDDGSQSYLRTDLGLRYAKESRFQYYATPLDLPDVTLVAPRLAGEFRYGLTKDLLFVQTAEVMTNVAGDTRTLVNTLSKISARLVGGLAIGASFAVNYDSAPAEGKVPTDTALALNLDYSI